MIRVKDVDVDEAEAVYHGVVLLRLRTDFVVVVVAAIAESEGMCTLDALHS